MIFSEIYGNYFNAVAAILEKAVSGRLSADGLEAIAAEKAFGESAEIISSNLLDETWPLLRKDLSTPIENAPSMPLTALQKSWLKALLADPRIRLFEPSPEGLEDVEPLFTPDMFVYYDRYLDGDPFEDEAYICNFRLIRQALDEGRRLSVSYESGRGKLLTREVSPRKLEYSPKDDKFRLIGICGGRALAVNLGRVRELSLLERETSPEPLPAFRTETLVMELTDERNALERCMLHFSNLEKETLKLDDRRYKVTLRYDKDDETEILIRVLSFGPVLRVLEPQHFVGLIKDRISKQLALGRKE